MVVLTVPEETIGELLERARAARQLSWRAMAGYMGVSNSALARWRNGEASPDPAYCEKIASYLRLPLADVLRAAGHPAPSAAEEEAVPLWLREVEAVVAGLTPGEREVFLRLSRETAQGLRALREERTPYGAPEEFGQEPPADEPPSPPRRPRPPRRG